MRITSLFRTQRCGCRLPVVLGIAALLAFMPLHALEDAPPAGTDTQQVTLDTLTSLITLQAEIKRDIAGLHRALFGDDPANVIPLWPQLKLFHRYRTYRVFHDAPGLPEVSGRQFLEAARQARVTGGNAASFLTAF